MKFNVHQLINLKQFSMLLSVLINLYKYNNVKIIFYKRVTIF